MMMTSETDVLKHEKPALLTNLQSFVQQSARAGSAIHEVELGLWRQLLALGLQLLGQFVALQGTGDVGETVPAPEGQASRRRLPQLHGPGLYLDLRQADPCNAPCTAAAKDKRSNSSPLDNRLQLPESNFFSCAPGLGPRVVHRASLRPGESRTLAKILGLKQSVDSLERMNAQMGRPVAAFREERPRPCRAGGGANRRQ